LKCFWKALQRTTAPEGILLSLRPPSVNLILLVAD